MNKIETLNLQMYAALKRITRYDSPDRLRRTSEKNYGLPYEDALEGAYENIQEEAKCGLKGVRLPNVKPVSVSITDTGKQGA
jgi:hypothetical protein